MKRYFKVIPRAVNSNTNVNQDAESGNGHSGDFSNTGNLQGSTDNSSAAMKEVSVNQDAESGNGHSGDFSNTGNLQGSTDNSSAGMKEVRKATNLYQVDFPDYSKVLECESTGQETIFDMVKREFKLSDPNRKPKFENMLFMKSNSDCLNIGLPVGVLSTEESYKCVFKKELVFRPSDLLRQYAVSEYDSSWEMGHFLVEKDRMPSKVSDFKKIIQNRMQVDFFKDETVLEALVRDGRFKNDVLPCCKITCDGLETHLADRQAKHCQGKIIKIVVDKQKEVTSLHKPIQPRPHPDIVTSVKVKPSAIKQKVDSAIAGPSSGAPFPLSTSTMTVNASGSSKSPVSREELTLLIERAFESKSQNLPVKDNNKLAKERNKLTKECNFALKQVDNTTFVRLLEVVTEIAKSVGVIFILNKHPQLIGTCFRIGTQYIITNNHVMEIIEEEMWGKTASEVAIFVDFNFMEGNLPDQSGRKYEAVHVPVVRSGTEELDFAILRMKEPPEELPPDIFKCGVRIMDPNSSPWSLLEGQYLMLIGHPEGKPKLIDPKCPVATASRDGLKMNVFTSKWCNLNDQTRGMYHVSNFFHGSSGSPGILLRNGKKLLVIIHTKGLPLDDSNTVEQGILLTEVYKHVKESIKKAQQNPNSGQNVLRDVKLEDIFPLVEGAEAMDIDQDS